MANLLLIEPDRLLAQTYREALQIAGHVVYICATAQAAIIAADEVRPDIVILELQLVGHSGIEFLYEFRSYTDWENIPLIVATQVPYSEFADCQQLLRQELGVQAYLYKPHTSLQRLLRTVHELMSSRSVQVTE